VLAIRIVNIPIVAIAILTENRYDNDTIVEYIKGQRRIKGKPLLGYTHI